MDRAINVDGIFLSVSLKSSSTIGGALININGINRGSHSLHQIYKSGLTKVSRYGWNMSFKTMIKGFEMTLLTDYATILYDAFKEFSR